MDTTINKPWKSYVFKIMKELIEDFWIYNIHGKDIKPTKDKFYNGLLEIWTRLNYVGPNKVENILKQVIWHNSLRKIEENR